MPEPAPVRMAVASQPGRVSRGVLIVGCDAPYGSAIATRLIDEGHVVAGVSYTRTDEARFPIVVLPELATADLAAELDAELPGFRPRAIVVLPRRPRVAPIGEINAEDFVAAIDETLVGTEVAARYLLARKPDGSSAQLVLLSGWAAMGLPCATTAAAISGALVGLARSWALELAPGGVSVNAVVAGPGVDGSAFERAVPPLGRQPTDADVAQAVASFLDDRAAALNGQVLFVCGGLTPGIVPL